MPEANPVYPCAIIEDGYTERGYVKGVPGLYPPVRFLYRRMAAPQQQAMYDEVDRQTDPAMRIPVQSIHLMRGYLLQWDVVNGKNQAVALSADALAKCTAPLFYRIRNIITCAEASDLDTAAPHLAQQVPVDVQHRMTTGEDVPAEVVDAKN